MNNLFKRFTVGVTASVLICASTLTGAQVPDLVPVPMQGGGSSALPNIGGEGGGLSWAEERDLGDYIVSLLQQDGVYEQDPLLHDYVAGIWQRLLNAAYKGGELTPELQQRMAWELFLIRDPSVNAFALPGAYVGVNLGLISAVETQDELASVLAHESVHIFQRHISRSYGLGKDLSAVSLASVVLGIVAMGLDPSLGSAIITGGTAASIQGEINFTRAMEHEADRIGYKVLVGAGYRPQGMADMFKRLAEASRFSDTTSYPYLRTHPLTDVRIAEAQMRFGIDAQSQVPTKDWLQEVMSARAQVLSNVTPDSLRAFVSGAYDASTRSVRENATVKMLYAGALAALKLKQFEQANAIYAKLATQVKDDSVVLQTVILLGADIALTEGNATKAQERMAQIDSPIPLLQRSVLFMQAQIAIARGDAPAAIKLLDAWVRTHARDELGWELLSRAYRQNKQFVLALRAEAESRMAIGDYDGAIDRFKAALGQGNKDNVTIYDLEVIQARLKTAQQLQTERHKLLK